MKGKMSQDNCPFTRTKKNDQIRMSPRNHRVAICFQLHDDLRLLYAASAMQGDAEWMESLARMRASLDYAKQADTKPIPVAPT